MGEQQAKPKKRRPHRATGRPRGPPPFEPTANDRDVVSMCMAMGLSQEQTAKQVRFPEGIGLSTLRKYFAAELADNGMRIHMRVAANMAAIAMDKNHKGVVLAGMFWLKSRLGWQQESVEVEVGFDGKKRPKGSGPIPTHFTLKIDRHGGSDAAGDGSATE